MPASLSDRREDARLTPPRTLRAALAPMLAALVTAGQPARAQPPAETTMQANFLPRFARYVAWPAARRLPPHAPIQLCVIGRDPFGPLLDRSAAARQVDGHGISVRRLPGAQGAEACHLAFVQGQQPAETGRLLLALRAQPILTITDARAGPQRGMIHFTNIAGRVRFFINDAEAAQHGLTISSRLLALAAGVTQRR